MNKSKRLDSRLKYGVDVFGENLFFVFICVFALANGALQVMGVLALVGAISLDSPFLYVVVVWFIVSVSALCADFIVTRLWFEPPSWRTFESNRLYLALFPAAALFNMILVNRMLKKLGGA